MPRKTALLKITVGDKIPKQWQWQFDNLKRIAPVTGSEDQYNRYLTAVAERLKQHARFEQASELHEKHLTDESRKLMVDEGNKLDRLQNREVQLLDAWRGTVKHMHDKMTVPEEDVRAVILASLSDKIENIQFTLNSGLLGSKVAQSIRKSVSEADFDVPLCKEHAL